MIRKLVLGSTWLLGRHGASWADWRSGRSLDQVPNNPTSSSQHLSFNGRPYDCMVQIDTLGPCCGPVRWPSGYGRGNTEMDNKVSVCTGQGEREAGLRCNGIFLRHYR